MQRFRRSGRIAKELDIVLLGTDTSGRVFSEETKTVVLSRHGAGIVSRYAFAPDEVLTLRVPGSAREAEIRLVGKIGGESGRYVYGVAFVDSDVNFWQMDFPPPESYEDASGASSFECSICRARRDLEQGDIEEDVYSINGNVLLFCEDCGTSTPWKKVNGPHAPVPAEVSIGVARPTLPALSAPPAPSFESRLPARPPALPQSEPAYSGSFNHELVTTAAVLDVPAPAVAIPLQRAEKTEPAAPRPMDSNGRPANRRRHMRIRVNFSACVRHPAHADDIVECENVSKGGLCFHSRKEYSVNSSIEVAAPFSPGEPALFVPAQIRRVEELPGGKVFRYGAAYLKPSPSSPAV
ncbi:MAG: PilZ domain-containing protein [Candidatus Acidiferrum sp.]